ncbi:CD3073 family putative ECF transporter S component [Clostridium sp. CF012]|uniref:CD3073 family putative ECF transporter S component n=1 Tax=Clostridium sp. CF012 TaxID=2843319 RepID=UPI001C0C51C3|nr:CD3073 family putative ECF transporter S component [Clostridium sp. CF012]MBU3144347.1 ECF transporter S component [Clostridium sp. CF012]
MRNKKVAIMIFCAVAIALNIVLGIVTSSLKLPLYLDTIGTIFIAVYFGPWYGAAVGALTNIITGIIFSPKDIPFLLVNVAVGLIVGFIAKKFNFNLVTAIITGLILSVVCPLIGTPIGIWVYGGLTGTGTDFLFIWLQKVGNNIFVSSFIAKITNNLLDKIASCILVWGLIEGMPRQYKKDRLFNESF